MIDPVTNGTTFPTVKPEVVFAYDLVRDVLAGKLRVPRFQRPYVWPRGRMVDLLDSVRQQYPIGSLLVWQTPQILASRSHIGHLRVLDREPPTGQRAYVLDGHQRLSTLAGVLTPRGDEADPDDVDPERWDIWYDAKEQEFTWLAHAIVPAAWQFPMARLMDTIAFLDECQRMRDQGGEGARAYVERVTRLAQTFQAYKLPVIRIEETDLKQAVQIFARLNSRGQRMTADQMISALAYDERGGESLRDLAADIDQIIEALAGVGFGHLDREIVLRAVLVALGEDLYRTDWTRIAAVKRDEHAKKLPDAVRRAKAALLRSAQFLHQEGVCTDRLLPYAMQIVVLSAFFDVQPHPAPWQIDVLRHWFWVTTFTAWFALANAARVRVLVKEFRRLAGSAEPISIMTTRLDEPAQAFPKRFDMRSARAKALLLMLLWLEPQNDGGALVERPWDHIASEGPDAIGRIVSTVQDKGLFSSPANRIVRWRADQAQAKTWLIGASDAVLLSHGIPPDARPLLEQGAHDEFLQRRLDYLIELERRFMEARGVTPPTEREPQPAPIDTDE